LYFLTCDELKACLPPNTKLIKQRKFSFYVCLDRKLQSLDHLDLGITWQALLEATNDFFIRKYGVECMEDIKYLTSDEMRQCRCNA
jgi:hypothetical protein